MHEYKRELRDPVYGLILFSGAECEIIDSPIFQRLRDIKQLAMGHMVYPGAIHTRFEHSLGCVHLSDLLIKRLRENSRDVLRRHYLIDDGNFERARKILRLAALLHDVGHPPFSHSGEDLLPIVTEGKTTRRLSHEDMTASLIRDTEIGEKIRHLYRADGIDPEDVIAVATTPSKAIGSRAHAYHLVLNEMLTGDLGSDRVDYLLRDGYHSGARAGQFDHERLIGEIALVSKPPGDAKSDEEIYGIGFGRGGWAVAEQMIAARYLMYTSLYFHKTKRIYEIHLKRIHETLLEVSWRSSALRSRSILPIDR